MPNYPKMKKLIIILTITLLSCNGQQAKHKELKEIATELNSLCPLMVDQGTRFDKVLCTSDNLLDLTFTLVNLVKDSTDTKGLENELKIFLSDHLKNGFTINQNINIDIEFLKQRRVTFHYTYLDKNGQSLTNIFIKPTDYFTK